MRYSLKEGVVFGVIIGVVVLLIRAFVGGQAARQFSALMIVGVVLAVAQLLLGLRRARQTPPADRPTPPEASPRPAPPQNPFARETNQAWTGLSSATVQELEQAEAERAAAADTPLEQPASDPSAQHPPADDDRNR